MKSRPPRARISGGKWIVAILVVLTGIYVWSAFLKRVRKPVYPPNAFFEVKRGDMLISVTEEGALRALNETVVRSSLDGLNRIINLVPEGTHVKKGELIVELDSSTLKDRLNEEELAHQERLFQLLQAQGNLKIQKSIAESQIKDAELVVENAESDLEKYRDGDAPLLIRTIESRSGVLAEQVRISTERLTRTQELFKSGNASRSELEADQLSLKREQLAFSQYQEDLRLVKKYDQPNQVRLLQSKVQQAKEELDRLKQRTSNELAQAEADLKTSERSVSILEESIKMQKRRMENAKIFAPQDGLVVYASVSPFQSMPGGGEIRRDEGRSRGGGGGGGGRGFGGGTSGEFRGSGRRGGRSGSEGSGMSSSGSGSSGSSGASSSAQSVSAANQRIASAISGNSAAQPATTGSAGGSGGGGGGASGASSGGGSRGGGAAGGGGSGGSGTASASSAFVNYPSMRPSSSLPTAGANSGGAGSGGGASGSGSGSGSGGSSSSSMSSGSGQSMSMGSSQFGFRSQNSQNFPSYEFFGTPGILEEGTMVRQRQELIRLPDVSKMLAETRIHESRVGQLRPGMTAYVRIENIPDRRFKGTVRRIAPLPDAQMTWMNPDLKVYPTDILIEDELPDLKPGVSARAEIVITNLPQVLSVPIQTVARFRGENVCFVKKGSGVTPVPVTTGWFNDRFIEVTSGLKEGDRVLLAPVSDETIEAESTETNEVESVQQPTPQPVEPPREEPLRGEQPRGERPIERRNFNGAEGEAQPSEGRGERQGRQGGRGRRSQQTQEAPE